jgi:hypothetical protein
LTWPCALASVALVLATFKVEALSYGSPVQAPLVSLAYGVTYACAGYFGFRRTGLVRTGTVVASAASIVAFIVQFSGFAVVDPSLLAAPFRQPFIFVILAVYLVIAISYAAVAGSVGGMIGRAMPPSLVDKVSAS